MIGLEGLTGREIAVCAGMGLGAAVTGLAWLPPLTALAGGFLTFGMVLIMATDFRHFIIPDILSLPAIPLGIAEIAVRDIDLVGDHLLAAGLGGGSLFLLRLAYRRLRGIEGLGLGDVKLAMAAGAWTGVAGLPWVLLIACAAALTAVLAQRWRSPGETLTLQSALPFGAFLAPAILAVWVGQVWPA